MIVADPVKIFPVFVDSPGFITVFRKPPPLDLNLSHFILVHIFSSKIHRPIIIISLDS